MKISPDRCTVVIAGAWNVAIFNPGFVAKNIFGGQEAPQPEMIIGPEGTSGQYTGSQFTFGVQKSKIIWRPLSTEPEVLQRVEGAAGGLLEVLSATPIVGIGFNYGFDVDEPTERLQRVLDLSDMAVIEESGEVSSLVMIKRSFSGDRVRINFSITCEANGPVKLDFNFHREVADAIDAKGCLLGSVTKYRDRAIQLLGDWYGLTLEAE